MTSKTQKPKTTSNLTRRKVLTSTAAMIAAMKVQFPAGAFAQGAGLR